MIRWTVWAVCALGCCVISPASLGAFIAGDVFYVANNKVYRTTDPGNYAAATPFVTLSSLSNGQIAFDADQSAMYVSLFNTRTVLKITSDGTDDCSKREAVRFLTSAAEARSRSQTSLRRG
jgi:hypothetical protein